MVGQSLARILGIFLMVFAVGTMSVALVGCGGGKDKKEDKKEKKEKKDGKEKDGKKKDGKKDGEAALKAKDVDGAEAKVGAKMATFTVAVEAAEKDVMVKYMPKTEAAKKALKFDPANVTLNSDTMSAEVKIMPAMGDTFAEALKGKHPIDVTFSVEGMEDVTKSFTFEIKKAK
ncbi:MAG: hypothetical protein ACFCD0_19785 [Gemmataceae bacterium]